MKRRFAVVAGGTAVGAALLVSGCNGDDTGANTDNMKLTAAQALTKASDKTGQADTFKADLTVTDTGDGGGKIHATGQFRLKPTLTFSAQLDEVSRGGSAVPGIKGQAIFTGDTLYAKVPQLARFVANGKPWVKIDVNKLGQTTGFDVKSLIDQVQKVSPAEQTKMFTASKDVRRVGQESVDGVKTTHYTGTVTVQDALNRLDAQARQKVQNWFPKSGANEKINFDLWTDKDGLPRKLESKGSSGQNSGTVTVLYSDYGKRVSVNAPPADQTGELSLNGLLGGANAPN
ncbi:LppX_LprAFG lipoprotein [Spirillospora sp. NPDC048911]|uniref:LppX_LprAFG lipoprotein n=1 Tax=Spirillospora sp. NPDC048911 TaxID=3364527 RepID=UPI00371084BE